MSWVQRKQGKRQKGGDITGMKMLCECCAHLHIKSSPSKLIFHFTFFIRSKSVQADVSKVICQPSVGCAFWHLSTLRGLSLAKCLNDVMIEGVLFLFVLGHLSNDIEPVKLIPPLDQNLYCLCHCCCHCCHHHHCCCHHCHHHHCCCCCQHCCLCHCCCCWSFGQRMGQAGGNLFYLDPCWCECIKRERPRTIFCRSQWSSMHQAASLQIEH
jgi:hypothetical protein